MRLIPTISALTLLYCSFASSQLLGEEATPKKEAPTTLTIKAEPLEVEVRLPGAFESSRITPIAAKPEEWSGLTIEEIVEHGKQVKPGTVLVRFDTKKFDVALEALESDFESSKLALRQGEASLESLTKSVPHQLANLRRTAREAKENLDRYVKTGRAKSIADMEQTIKSSRNSLMYAREELNQLEKMYNADDLTEETEEIILIRSRNGVQSTEYRVQRTIDGQKQFYDVDLPRRQANLERSRDASALALEGAEFTLPASLTEKNLALEKLRVGHRKTEQKLERMKKDRTELIVRAPSAGVVYYGQAVRGKWPDATASGKTLIKGAAVKPKQVLMTIVNNDKLFVRATLEEKQLSEVRRGDKALIISKAFPSTRLRGTVRDISSIPIAPGKFDAVVDYSSNKDARQLVAGMTCEVVVDVYSKSNAILVPKTAVDLDEDGSRGFVYLVGDKDKQKKQRVRVGRTVNKRLEILSGLKADDKILINNPD